MQPNSVHWPVAMDGTESVTIRVCSLIQALSIGNGRHRECYNQSMQPNSGHWLVVMEGTESVTIKVCSLIKSTGQWQWKAQGVSQSKYAA